MKQTSDRTGTDAIPRPRTAGRVLLVEDSPGQTLLMRIAFAERLPDALLDVIEDGDLALSALLGGESETPDLLLLDLHLPRLPGHQVLAALRGAHDPRLRRLPVVVLSTSREPDDVARSYELGANSHIGKPHSMDDLYDVVGSLGRYWFETVALP
jgi:DNA-binding response OmpR family regulator